MQIKNIILFYSTMDTSNPKDSRKCTNFRNLAKEKWLRQIRSEDPINRSFTRRNKIADPANSGVSRSRTESPPPKRYRSDRGINKGTAPACSYCRPEICKRMYNTAMMNRYMKISIADSAK